MSTQFANGATELCHLVTVPVWPDKVSVPLELPKHTLVPPLTLPPTDTGSTDTMTGVELATEQLPLWMTALNSVVWVSAPEV
jgi:hypothetical protein